MLSKKKKRKRSRPGATAFGFTLDQTEPFRRGENSPNRPPNSRDTSRLTRHRIVLKRRCRHFETTIITRRAKGESELIDSRRPSAVSRADIAQPVASCSVHYTAGRDRVLAVPIVIIYNTRLATQDIPLTPPSRLIRRRARIILCKLPRDDAIYL